MILASTWQWTGRVAVLGWLAATCGAVAILVSVLVINEPVGCSALDVWHLLTLVYAVCVAASSIFAVAGAMRTLRSRMWGQLLLWSAALVTSLSGVTLAVAALRWLALPCAEIL